MPPSANRTLPADRPQPPTTKPRGPPTAPVDADAAAIRKRALVAQKQYGRGDKISTRGVQDRKLRGNLRALEDKSKDAAVKAKDAEILLENTSGFIETEGELERSYKVRQDDIQSQVGIETAKKGFELRLDAATGPYKVDYTRNGVHMLLSGRKGHVATMDWRKGKLACELQLRETVRDAKWLHNNQFFAVAQRKHVYVYDHQGVEVQALQDHVDVTHMEFLPFHFLLGTVGNAGWLKYQDTSTGRLVSQMPTKQGAPTAFGQNPHNAILHVGHQNGTVSLWSPNDQKPLVKVLAHSGPVRSLAMDREGRYMVSTGQDAKMSVWDVRMFREVNSYFLRSPGSSVSISDTDLTAVGWGTQTTVWRGLFDKNKNDQVKVQSPYMAWGGEGNRVERVQWCPYDDVLGIGHGKGFSSVIVPGAGEANPDSLELLLYETPKQRQEGEVKALLNKLQPEMISLDPGFIGQLDRASDAQRQQERDLDRKPQDPLAKIKNRGRGKNSSLRKYLRKQGSKNIIDERKVRIQELRKEQAKRINKARQGEVELGPALARFARKA